MASPRPSRLSLEEFCAPLGGENAHGRQVAALALRMFDATHRWFGIPRADRPILEAACRLHDLGYRAAARRHAEAGSELILAENLQGIDAGQRERIALLVRLHPIPLKFETARSAVQRYPDAPRLLAMLALLRIADHLDYCHLQDGEIVSVRGARRGIRIGLRTGHSALNLEMARRQLALWRGAFPADLQLRVERGGAARIPPVLAPSQGVPEGVRRLLFSPYRTVLANVEGALVAVESEALHELRIAVRRMRMVLRAFRKALRPVDVDRIDRDLQQLNRILGAARDLDVWIGFVSTEAVAAQFTGHRLWPVFVAHQLELRRLQQVTVRRQLRGVHFASLRTRLDRLLRVELPDAFAAGPYLPWEKVAGRSLAKAVRRALDLGHLRSSPVPEKLHRLRIALRRLRYLEGFFGGAFGRPVQKLGRRAHAVERRLGAIRDADLALERIGREGPPPPRLLVRHLQRLRRANTEDVERAWTRFDDPALRDRVRRLWAD